MKKGSILHPTWYLSTTPGPLLGPQDTRALALGGALALVALVKGHRVVVVTAEVVEILDLVDTDDPVLTGERLLERVQLRAFRGESRSTHAVNGLAGTEQGVEVVVGHFVPAVIVSGISMPWQIGDILHQAVTHGGGGTVVHPVLTAGSEEVTLLDLVGPDTLGDTDHPQELVDVVTGVAQQSTKHHQHVVNIVLTEDGVTDLLTGAHRLTNSGNVGVVPRVVVNQGRAVRHTTDLVAVIPPGHDLGVVLSVLAEPVVRLTVIIDDVLASIRQAARENHRWGGVGVGGDPGAVRNEKKQIDDNGGGHDSLGQVGRDPDIGLPGGTKTVRVVLVRLGAGVGAVLREHIRVENGGEGQSSRNTNNRGQGQHQTNHDTGEVTGKHRVDDDKDVLILEIAEAHVDTSREEPDQEVQIKEEGGPSGGLVLGDGGNDRDVDLGIAGVPQRVETTAPRGNHSGHGEDDKSDESDSEDNDDHGSQKSLEVLARDETTDEVSKGHELNEAEDTWQGQYKLFSLAVNESTHQVRTCGHCCESAGIRRKESAYWPEFPEHTRWCS